jgi:hypothetical protein
MNEVSLSMSISPAMLGPTYFIVITGNWLNCRGEDKDTHKHETTHHNSYITILTAE